MGALSILLLAIFSKGQGLEETGHSLSLPDFGVSSSLFQARSFKMSHVIFVRQECDVIVDSSLPLETCHARNGAECGMVVWRERSTER